MSTQHSPNPPQYKALWLWVGCLFGMDYLSSLAYIPSVAYSAAGLFSPVVITLVVLATLILTVPLYCYTASRSPHGNGTLGLLEKIFPGWPGKLCVVILLGFTATDLVFTRTFSAADAAEHIIHSPILKSPIQELETVTKNVEGRLPGTSTEVVRKTDRKPLIVAVLLLLAGTSFGWFFRKGVDHRLIKIAAVAVLLFLFLTALIVFSGLWYLFRNQYLVHEWWENVRAGQWHANQQASPMSLGGLLLAGVILFPQVALGLSGYELTLAAMPMIQGNKTDTRNDYSNRIRKTRLMLITLAVVMCTLMLGAGFVTSILIPHEEMLPQTGTAENRCLAYIAYGSPLNHQISPDLVSPFFGKIFGGLYDLCTITVLTISGVVVLIGTRELIPPYLHRLGMEWDWSRRLGLMMHIFTITKIGVTAFFHADVEAQRGAYLTGVLALFAAGAITATVDVWQRRAGRPILFRLAPLFITASLVFLISLIVVVIRQPIALRMAGVFVMLLIFSSMITRFVRTREMRFEGFDFTNEESRLTFWHLQNNDYPMLLPIRPGQDCYIKKEQEIRDNHRLPVDRPVVFIEADLADPSDFYHRPMIDISMENSRVIVRITNCTSVPHAIAACALEIAKAGPIPEVHFGWSHENPLTANINFVLFGQGNVPWMVRELIRTAKVAEDRKPKVIVG